MKPSRRSVLAAAAALSLASPTAAASPPGFVTREGMGLKIDGRPYRSSAPTPGIWPGWAPMRTSATGRGWSVNWMPWPATA